MEQPPPIRRNLQRKLVQLHESIYGRKPTIVAWAPGRIEVLGNHTDYNEGTVLSAAIDRGHLFCISPSDESDIRLTAGDEQETVRFDLSPAKTAPALPGWANYVRGVFYLLAERGVRVDEETGVDCSFLGNIPIGSGLSSSAALEVSAALAACAFRNKELPRKEIAMLCREAEHRFAGCNCGLLDQFSSLFGTEGGLLYCDFRSLETRPVPLPPEACFLVVNPKVKHALAASPYNARRESCERTACFFREHVAENIRALRDVSPALFAAHKQALPPEDAKRAEHVIGEIDRVKQAVRLLKEGDLEGFGRLLYASHESSQKLFENSSSELDIVVEAARRAGAPGARLSGGGWGGCAIVLVRREEAGRIAEAIAAECRRKGFDPDVLTVLPSAGAHTFPFLEFREDE